MVLHCSYYDMERKRLKDQLDTYAEHAKWADLDTSDNDALFGIVMGVRPMLNSTEKQRKVALSYCRQFLTTALRRRERLLATLPKPKKARPEVAHRSSSDEAKEQADDEAVAEDAVDQVADRNDLPNQNPHPDPDVELSDVDVADAHDVDETDVDSDYVSESDSEGKAGQPIVVQ